ncbi:hypothetical protein R1flu_026760 [Riccia fluitans]|uniref:Amine oxidase n=1 Tax=Riccia fluitans TaxID=41844 RepID=A0ABD1XGV5_9MARC
MKSSSNSVRWFVQLVSFSVVMLNSCSLTGAHTHPLDPLCPGELLLVRSILINASIMSPVDNIIATLEVEEPEKSVVKAWKPGQELPPRKALESLAKRGLNYSEIVLLPLAPGWYDVPEDEGLRLNNVQFTYANGTVNYFMRPIAGLFAVVDLDEKQVYKYIDSYSEDIPLPKREGTDYRLEAQEPPVLNPLKIISTEQPNGTSFTVNNHIVQWGSYWRFHLKLDSRAGTVISMAEVLDDGVWRSRLWHDAGEYGFGANASPLQPLNDCPRNAQYLDVVLPSASGLPLVKSNRICIFERYSGDVAWRHTETFAPGGTVLEARPKVTLVVRMVSSVGNYDYVLDWEFQTDGLIRALVGMTRIIQTSATKFTSVKNDEGNDGDSLHGILISENLVGVVHDHFLTFHLYLDIDGTKNSFVESKLKRRHIQPGSGVPRKSYWDTEKHIAQTEADARIQLSLQQPSEYFVINSEKTTRLGNPVGYRLVPGATAATLLDPEDPPQVRAAFVKNQIWVTQYHKEEKYAGGEFVYQSHGDDTLSVWSSKNRKIANEDIVLWYTVGFHHIPVQEDFPIMPTISGSFELKPANFFEDNPILKAQPNTAAEFSAYFGDVDIKVKE